MSHCESDKLNIAISLSMSNINSVITPGYLLGLESWSEIEYLKIEVMILNKVSICGRWGGSDTMICQTWDGMMQVLPFWWPWTGCIICHWVSLMAIWFWYWLLWEAPGHLVCIWQKVGLFDHGITSCHYRDAMISIAQGQEGFESLVGDSPNYRVIGW